MIDLDEARKRARKDCHATIGRYVSCDFIDEVIRMTLAHVSDVLSEIGSGTVSAGEASGIVGQERSAQEPDATSRTQTGSFDRSVDSDPRAAVTTETRPNDELGRKTERAVCGLCGKPMPEGEEMFNYHGYSGPCPQ